MKITTSIVFMLFIRVITSQHLLSCPDNKCWCCKFKSGKCYNKKGKTPCCCSVADTYPCYETPTSLVPYGCCATGSTCCFDGCCPPGTTCCGERLCCYDKSYNSRGLSILSDQWLKPKRVDSSWNNLTGVDLCGSQNCFCCCEELVCPIKQSGSTESCAARSQDIDLYCDEMSVCLKNSLEKTTAEERGPTFEDLETHVISDEMMKNPTKPGKINVIDMTFITRIRQKFYDHMKERKKNFQFAVFKFGPSDSYWDPTIDDSGLCWSGSQLVVEETGNNWQASAYASCEDGCHTEAAIINEDQTYGYHHMLSRECEQQPPHILNIYSFNSPCITTPGFGCQELIQKTLLYFFSLHDVDCNKREWKINIAWTMQFRDQTAQQCLENWEAFEDDMEEHPNIKVAYGRQNVGKITG